jgi:uncharacterized membrane protein YccC
MAAAPCVVVALRCTGASWWAPSNSWPPGMADNPAVSGYAIAVGRSALIALRPGDNPWAAGAALRAVAAAGLIALIGAFVGDLPAVSVAYLGAACAVAFVPSGTYRARSAALLSQALGAAAGISVGALSPHSAVGLIVTATLAGVVSGMTGALGPDAPGFGMMLSIGVAFAQLGGSPLPWCQQALWYLAGTLAVATATLTSWSFRRGLAERQAVAEVFFAAADLCAAIGTPVARAARARLAAASARARRAANHRRAELVAFAAATLYAQGQTIPQDAIDAIRAAGIEARTGATPAPSLDVDNTSPGLAALADALSQQPLRPAAPLPAKRRLGAMIRAVTTPAAAANGARIGLCLGVATAATVWMHAPTHSFWLPLTVAVIVRPEYASVFVRTVNRVCGTLIGALLAAVVLAAGPSPVWVAAVAALALGFAVLSAPKLYGLSVIGVTASALLSASIGHIDPFVAGLRLLDTVVGALVAIIFGYLLWPGARRVPSAARLDAALRAAHAYLREAVKPPAERTHWQSVRDDAYRLAHQAHAACQAAIVEPPPVSAIAAQLYPATIGLEDAVDTITAIAATVDAGKTPADLIDDVDAKLATIQGHPRS